MISASQLVVPAPISGIQRPRAVHMFNFFLVSWARAWLEWLVAETRLMVHQHRCSLCCLLGVLLIEKFLQVVHCHQNLMVEGHMYVICYF